MWTMPTIFNAVEIIISHIKHTVYIRFTAFWNFSKWQFVFATFGFSEISTPVGRTILTMVNVVQTTISEFAHTVYIRFTGFWNFSKLLFVLHILASIKSSNPVMPTTLSMVKTV